MIRLIFGRPRMGKTTLARGFVRESRRVIFVDPFPVPDATPVWEWTDAHAIDWTAPSLRVAWHADPDYELIETLDDIDIVIDDPDGACWKGGQVRDIALHRILTRCGHYKQRITIITHTPTLVPLGIRRIAFEVYAFAFNDSKGFDYCKREWGITVPSRPLNSRAGSLRVMLARSFRA